MADISLTIDGQVADPRRFAVPEMSLSSARERMRQHTFSLELENARLCALLSDHYQRWVQESRQDDLQCGGPQDELAEAGYPDLQDIARDRELSDLVFAGYLQREWLEAVTWPGEGEIIYWLDQLSIGDISDGVMRFEGTCYSRGS